MSNDLTNLHVELGCPAGDDADWDQIMSWAASRLRNELALQVDAVHLERKAILAEMSKRVLLVSARNAPVLWNMMRWIESRTDPTVDVFGLIREWRDAEDAVTNCKSAAALPDHYKRLRAVTKRLRAVVDGSVG